MPGNACAQTWNIERYLQGRQECIKVHEAVPVRASARIQFDRERFGVRARAAWQEPRELLPQPPPAGYGRPRQQRMQAPTTSSTTPTAKAGHAVRGTARAINHVTIPRSRALLSVPPRPPPDSWSRPETSRRVRVETPRLVPRIDGLGIHDLRTFLTKPLHVRYDTMHCRVTRRRDRAWKQASVFHVHHVHKDGATFMMTARRQALSRTTNFYVSTSPEIGLRKDTPGFVGKVRAGDKSGSTYTVYDDGVSPRDALCDGTESRGTRNELAGVIFSSTGHVSDGARGMEVAIPDGGKVQAHESWDTSGTIVERLREGRRRPGLVRMRDRKPRYDHRVRRGSGCGRSNSTSSSTILASHPAPFWLDGETFGTAMMRSHQSWVEGA